MLVYLPYTALVATRSVRCEYSSFVQRRTAGALAAILIKTVVLRRIAVRLTARTKYSRRSTGIRCIHRDRQIDGRTDAVQG